VFLILETLKPFFSFEFKFLIFIWARPTLQIPASLPAGLHAPVPPHHHQLNPTPRVGPPVSLLPLPLPLFHYPIVPPPSSIAVPRAHAAATHPFLATACRCPFLDFSPRVTTHPRTTALIASSSSVDAVWPTTSTRACWIAG
jgi:hypothetical protein